MRRHITERKRTEAALREAQQALHTTNRELETKVEERTQELRQSLHTLAGAHDERKKLLSRLVTAQEEERKRIAHDIHDDTIQKMAGVALRLDILELDHPEVAVDPQFKELGISVREAIDRLRRLMFDLRPQILDKPGLGTALGAYVEQLSGREGGFAFDIQSRLSAEPPEDLRLTLFRIAQEALNNVVNHARARNVRVRVDDHEGGVLVRIADDGVGFEVGDRPVSPNGHLGLTAMRERAEIARGWLKLSSRPGEGTSVKVWIPVPEEGQP